MLTAYPRPGFARENWENLNGTWQFAFDEKNLGIEKQWFDTFPASRDILVPYSYETKKSGIGEEAFCPVVWYQRELDIKPFTGRMLLHFEGVDYEALVFLNGQYAGGHQGGYAAFSVDITPFVQPGTNRLTVCVKDSNSMLQPRGKQRWLPENFGCWYVQTTGIWKTVWLENVPDVYLDHVKIVPDIDRAAFVCTADIKGLSAGQTASLGIRLTFEGEALGKQSVEVKGKQVQFTVLAANPEDLWGIKLWHPDHPHLYQMHFTLTDEGGAIDQVTATAGLRKIEIRDGQVLLNHLPIYQRLILDQGYWPDSHLTPPDDHAYEKDLDLILAAGYNGLRKHQKTEDRRFLHLCDQKGILVWSEMAAQYAFSDTGMGLFTQEWLEVVAQNHNHPSVIVWTPFNESWGIGNIWNNVQQQQFSQAIYHLTKAYDAMRPIVINDGWEHTVSDIITLHDYEEDGSAFASRYADLPSLLNNHKPHNGFKYAMAQGFYYRSQPVIISEYGGIAFTDQSGWGYGKQVKDEAAFLDRFNSITSAIQNHPGIAGYCYTQVSDVQQEVNGLFTPDRKPKADLAKIREINLKRR